MFGGGIKKRRKKCHSDDRREEDVLLNEVKNLEYINVDVIEILRFALNDNQGEYLVLITSNVPRRSQ